MTTRAPSPQRIEHRPTAAAWIGAAAAGALFAVMSVVSFVADNPVWITATLLGLCAFAAVGVLEIANRRVTLTPVALESVSNFRRRVIARADIASVTWEKGAGAAVKLVDGRWVRLPPVGASSQGLANSVRAWLNRAPQVED